jgi:hypothetical protein
MRAFSEPFSSLRTAVLSHIDGQRVQPAASAMSRLKLCAIGSCPIALDSISETPSEVVVSTKPRLDKREFRVMRGLYSTAGRSKQAKRKGVTASGAVCYLRRDFDDRKVDLVVMTLFMPPVYCDLYFYFLFQAIRAT